ncbi:hypothetical protein PtA15_7A534 [Puccinia triticina]|uniref:G-protein coupled receptors family 2 profile 2 domain-containing protein n=1 Tax=Puccinia triticina TaxID=208348 RepID=A0ABY7CQ48_9BASI|nr:uncharacterized protein PtA15_7A534 [Puccinia triticina]WAQ86805.1 hypothetical protein PtA15_7A534 [Puccinia triticina]
MAASSLSAASHPSEILPTLNSMSLILNPYPFILHAIEEQKLQFAYRNLLSFDLALIVVHLVLLVQATITLALKLFFLLKNGQRSQIWLCRTHYLVDQAVPYLVPNGNFVIEPLQITGCIFFEFFSIIVYLVIKNPNLGMSIPGLHASCLFWFAASFVPGFIGFWLSGWSAFYVLFLSPVHSTGSSGGRKRILYHPVFMNAMCWGVPVLISCFFTVIGIVMTVKHKRVRDAYEVLFTRLHQLAEDWKPNNPQTLNDNQHLVNIMEFLLAEGSRIFDLLQLMAIGWATTAVVIITFYIATMITIGKVTQRTMSIANGRSTLFQHSSKNLLSKPKNLISESHDDLNSKAETDYSLVTLSTKPAFRNSVSANSIQRNLFFIRTSCGLMVIALGFNICTSLIFVAKIRALLIQSVQIQSTKG